MGHGFYRNYLDMVVLKYINKHFSRLKDSLVSLTNKLRAGRLGVGVHFWWDRNFSVHRPVQTDSGAHPVTYLISTTGRGDNTVGE
jgi:hypothetical protein